MRRTQIQLDEDLHASLRRMAYEQGTSMASIIRDTLNEALGISSRPPRVPRKLAEFPFVGSGRSRQGGRAPVSEHHDEALAEALARKSR